MLHATIDRPRQLFVSSVQLLLSILYLKNYFCSSSQTCSHYNLPSNNVMMIFIFSLELYETLGKLKESKKVYKRQIHEESGASSTETDSDVYKQYKATKYNIRLIKALIEKQA